MIVRSLCVDTSIVLPAEAIVALPPTTEAPPGNSAWADRQGIVVCSRIKQAASQCSADIRAERATNIVTPPIVGA